MDPWLGPGSDPWEECNPPLDRLLLEQVVWVHMLRSKALVFHPRPPRCKDLVLASELRRSRRSRWVLELVSMATRRVLRVIDRHLHFRASQDLT